MICPGAQKAATTSLFHLLRQHPQVFLPECKETHFFEEHRAKGIAWYEGLFSTASKTKRIIGDITPAYMYFDFVPASIHHILGHDIKFLVMLRNPVDRAFSHYCMEVRLGFEMETFERALELESTRLKGSLLSKRQFSYIDRGFYARQIRNFLAHYPIDHFHFVLFEDFIVDMGRTFRGICEFLAIDRDVKITAGLKENAGKRRGITVPSELTRRRLRDLYADENRELERTTGLDLTCWG